MLRVAYAFNDILKAEFINAGVSINLAASACATLLVGYFSQIDPDRRALILSEMVDVIIEGFRDNADTDLLN